MKKNISAALLSIACFSAVSAAAFADGPVANAINGIGLAGEDIVNGAGDAVTDIVDGVTGAASDIEGGVMGIAEDDGTLDPGGSDGPADSDVDGDASGDDESDIPSADNSDVIGDEISGDASDDSSDPASEESGSVGGVNAANPGTGVPYGLTAAAAVLAAVGVVAASSRKNK